MNKTYQAQSGFIKRTIAGETILVPVGTNTQKFNGMIMLNDSGSYIWDLLKNPISREELIKKMSQEFDAGIDVISNDVDEFIENGVREDLITVKEN